MQTKSQFVSCVQNKIPTKTIEVVRSSAKLCVACSVLSVPTGSALLLVALLLVTH